jgi:hypothetical protein
VSQPPDHHGPSYKLPSPPPPDPTGWIELRRKARATLWPPVPVAWAGLLALAVAAAGLHGLWFLGSLPGRLPSPTDWKAVAALVAREARAGDAVALSPAWAERAREVLPERLPSRPEVALPLLALPSYVEADEDLPGVRRVWLVSLPGAPGASPRIARQLASRSDTSEGPLQVGRLDLTRYDLRSPLLPLHSFTDRLASASVRSPGARVARETREVDLLPRTCIVVSFPGPLPEPATLAFPAVPLGRVLRGHLGLVGDVFAGAPSVSLRVKVDGIELGRGEATAARPAWSAFQIDTARISGQTRQVTLEVVPSGPLPRGVCIDLMSLP